MRLFNYKNLRITQKITILFIFLIVLPAASFSCYFYSSQLSRLYGQALQDRQTSIDQLTNNLNTTFLSVEELSRDLAYKSSIVGLLSRRNLDQFPTWYANYFDQSVLALKYSLKYQNLGINNIAVYSNNHSVKEKDNFYHSTRIFGQDFYRDFKENKKDFDFYLLEKEKAKSYFESKDGEKFSHPDSIVLCVRKILDSSSEHELGLLVFEMSPDQLFDSVEKANQKGGKYSLLLPNKGFYGASPLAEVFSCDSSHLKGSGQSSLHEESRDYFYSTINQFDIIVTDSNYVDKKAYTSPTLRISLIFAWIALIQFFIMNILTRRIFAAVNHDISQIDSIIQNDFNGQLPETRHDEIGDLERRYNILLNKINTLISNIVQKEIASKTAQLKALQYQINPHFIYNTLNVFSGNAEKNGNYELSEAISYFGHLLRYNMKDDGIYSTVGLELENAVSLIKVYSMKYLGKLRLQLECTPEVKKCKIIKFLIQPILENSVLHGFRSRNDDMNITITAVHKGESLVIKVMDDGIGMSAQRLSDVRGNIFRDVPLQDLSSENSSFIGLNNVYKRIMLFYGENSSLEIDSREDSFTCVTVRIPYNKTREEM